MGENKHSKQRGVVMRNDVYKRGNYWYLRYYDKDGKLIRESTKQTRKRFAQKLLKQRENEVADGTIRGLHHTTWFKDLLEDYWKEFKRNCKSIRQTRVSYDYVYNYFKDYKAVDIKDITIKNYFTHRINTSKRRPANGTLNKDLSIIQRTFTLGVENDKVSKMPNFKKLRLRNALPRSGYIDSDTFEQLYELVPDYLKPVIIFAYRTGWRKSEILNLKWSRVGVTHGKVTGKVRLAWGETKTDKPRTIYVDKVLKAVLQELWNKKESGNGINQEYVFINKSKRGKITDFRIAWYNAVDKLGKGKLYFHDFRRTFCTNAIDAGLDEKTAMLLSGHRTPSIFKRYQIVSEERLQTAMDKIDNYLNHKAA